MKRITTVGFIRLYAIFGFIIIVFIGGSFFTTWQLSRESKNLNQMQNEVYPYVSKLNELNALLTESKLLITAWIYLPDNYQERKRLQQIYRESYPNLKSQLYKAKNRLDNLGIDSIIVSQNRIISAIDTLFLKQQIITETLLSEPKDYSAPFNVFQANEQLTVEIYPRIMRLQQRLGYVVELAETKSNKLKGEVLQSFQWIRYLSIIIALIIISLMVFIGRYIYTNVTKPVIAVKDILLELSVGRLPKPNINPNEPVIMDMLEATNKLAESFSNTAKAAYSIGHGNFDTPIKPLSSDDILGEALLTMKTSLQSYASEMEEKVNSRTKLLQEQKQELQKKQNRIVASINYAQRIQKAIIPKEEKLQELFESFVLFRPKDIVSGDFYWLHRHGNKTVIAVADCTGHGVPGALMTMIGYNILNSIVRDKNICEPDQILNQMPLLLKTALAHGDREIKDGMDISIVTITESHNKSQESTKYELSCAGAMNPIYLARGGEIRKIKADKQPIGGKIKEGFAYTKHRFTIQKDETAMLYMLSDGFQDQFGGPDNRKFMIKKLRNQLNGLANQPVKEQKNQLAQTFDQWKEGYKQTDDVLIIGLHL